MPEIQNFQLNNAVNSHARKLWFAAKRNFYYRDDPFRAALLCKQIIAASAFSEEADEAKLLLHDIRIEIRKLAGGIEKERRGRRRSHLTNRTFLKIHPDQE